MDRYRSTATAGLADEAAPCAVSRWYACDITAGRDVTIGKASGEADRRDPGHAQADLGRGSCAQAETMGRG